ncbi:hypothetical protein EI983_16495 [Roseovarius faecimaris]|uniref:Phosphodiester glycosidase domain-containing protein n=1 Tax=Roseovarius faecimaris TaxID=2494550 RepID=A0A6I6J4U4_9RHOB|nr:phosphodiester glycosidase family protein [Roseovarius faecimaris]QGX99778.1 hypothetical protein EI983_16495 [Roseovarius faecimaris]
MRWLVSALMLLALPAAAVECRDLRFQDQVFTLCEVNTATEDLRLFLTDPETGRPLGSFENVEARLGAGGERLAFAMNAGMYHADRSPVGHYVEDGQERSPVISSDGPGNFGLLPNGIFCVSDGVARVIETRRFLRERPACRYASQSGPMLVIDGALHPRFLKQSDSTYIRNGVGTTADGKTAYFVISQAAVNFYTFGSLFKEVLKVPQALYFDGNISRLYAPGIGRSDGGFPMGPIVGVVASSE